MSSIGVLSILSLLSIVILLSTIPACVATNDELNAAVVWSSAENTNNIESRATSSWSGITIVNNCGVPLYIEARATVWQNNQWFVGAPLPSYGTTTYLASKKTLNYTIPAAGLASTKFWAKYGCDSTGRNCIVGDQMQYWGGFSNPNAGCPAKGCTPPVDSLFEATWGCSLSDRTKCAKNPSTGGPLGTATFFDTSHVDGYTLPYLVEMQGSGVSQCDVQKIDGSKLDLKKCPKAENLSMNGRYRTATDASIHKTYSLTNASLVIRSTTDQKAVGCIAPCKLLNSGQPYGYNQAIGSQPTVWMCCPTPVPNANDQNCKATSGCVTPNACRTGPIEQTQYVKAIHSMISNTYAYSYDDVNGLHTCPSGTTSFKMTFCPAGSPAFPATV